METIFWRTFNGDRVKVPIQDEIRAVIRREKSRGHELKVCIGTDSQVKSRETAFATVIVCIRKGKGGFMYIRSEVVRQPMTIKERMLVEVGKTIEVAIELCPAFNDYGVDLEVHADINTNPAFRSHDALKDAMGYILGMGFAFRAKPEAFASSSCANKMVQ